MGRALLARVPERVGEHEAPFGVGVRDLDRLAVGGGEDVARPHAPPARHVLGGCHDGDRANRDLELRDRADPGDDGGRAGHVALHVLHVRRRLQRDAAGVERHPLADEPEQDVAAAGRGRRLPAQHDEAGLVVASRADAEQGAHAEVAHLVRAERLRAETVRALGDARRVLGEALRRQVVRGPVDEVPRAVRP